MSVKKHFYVAGTHQVTGWKSRLISLKFGNNGDRFGKSFDDSSIERLFTRGHSHLTIAQINFTLAMSRHRCIVRHHNHRAAVFVEFRKESQNFLAGFAVERARGFIGKNDRRVRHDRASHRHALALTA